MNHVACIVNYNTQELTVACIRSFFKSTPDAHVVVFDNSDRFPFVVPDEFVGRLDLIDNTHGQVIDFDRWLSSFPNKAPTNNAYASAKHCYTIQWLIDHRRRPFLLMDSDVLVHHDVSPLFDSRYVYVGEQKLHKSRFGNLMRVMPFLCYINVPLVKQYGITFYNPKKMFALSNKYPDAAYDTGCWFYEDCYYHHVPVRSISYDDYVMHFGHGSWKDKDARSWLDANRTLWE